MSEINIPHGVIILELGKTKVYLRWNQYEDTWVPVVALTSEYFGGADWKTVYAITTPDITRVLYEGLGKHREAPRVVEMYLCGEIS